MIADGLPDALRPEGRNDVHRHTHDHAARQCGVKPESVVHGNSHNSLVICGPSHALLYVEIDVYDTVVGQNDRFGPGRCSGGKDNACRSFRRKIFQIPVHFLQRQALFAGVFLRIWGISSSKIVPRAPDP